MALALEYGRDEIEREQLKWDELTRPERAAIASELESQRHLPEFHWIKVGDLYVDEAYQRPVSEDRVWQIVKQFTWRLFEPLWIAHRKGRLYIVDGRHRFSAAQIFGPDLMPEVPCSVRRTASVEEEAQTFVELQEKRRRLTSFQRFQAKLLYGDPIAKDLERIMSRNGFKAQDASYFSTSRWSEQQEGVIVSIGTLEALYGHGGRKLVDNVLYVIRKAWEGMPPSTGGIMLRAVARCFDVIAGLNPDRFASKLSKKDLWGLVERGQRFGHSNSIPQSEALADVLKTVYEQ